MSAKSQPMRHAGGMLNTSLPWRAVMDMNRVHFQPRLSLPTFLQRFGMETAREAAPLKVRWASGFVCPKCQATGAAMFSRRGRTYWQCSTYHHQTSLRAGMVFERARLPLTTWFMTLHLLTQSKTSVAALELMRHSGVCYRTAWRLKHKLMQTMCARESSRQLVGVVQIADADLGGERNGGKRGRGSESKCPFAVSVATDEEGYPGMAVIEPVSGFTKSAMGEWFSRWLMSEAERYSDGLGAFRAAIDSDHPHTTIDAGGGRAAM